MAPVRHRPIIPFGILAKPGQSKKTFWMLERLIEKMREIESDTNEITIMLCNNRLLETSQLEKRCQQDLPDTIVFSSKSDCRDYNGLYYRIQKVGLRRVIMCTNTTRVKDLSTLVEDLVPQEFTFNIWIDEVDANFNVLEPFLAKCNEFEYAIKNITAISGTVDKLYEKFDSLNIIPLGQTHDENYLGLKDHKWTLMEGASRPEGYINSVLSTVKIPPKSRWYVPADIAKKSHQAVASMLVKYGMVAIILNGDGITTCEPGKPPIIRKKEGGRLVSDIFIDIVGKYGDYPIAVTGNMCIERGITIMSEKFFFNFAILSNMSDHSKAAQAAWRTCGQYKHFQMNQIEIFTTKKMKDVVMDLNKKSLELATLANELKNATINDTDEDEFKGIPVCHKDYENIRYSPYEKKSTKKKIITTIFLQKHQKIAKIMIGAQEHLSVTDIVSRLSESDWNSMLKERSKGDDGKVLTKESDPRLSTIRNLFINYNVKPNVPHDTGVLWEKRTNDKGIEVNYFAFNDELKLKWREYLITHDFDRLPKQEYMLAFELMLSDAADKIKEVMTLTEMKQLWKSVPQRWEGSSNSDDHWIAVCYLFCRTGKVVDSSPWFDDNVKNELFPKKDGVKSRMEKSTTVSNLTQFRSKSWRETAADGRHLREENGQYKLAWK